MKKKYGSRAMFFAGVAGFLIAAVIAGIFFAVAFGGTSSMYAASKFAAVYHIIDARFVGEADMEEISNAAYRAMVDAIDDRWSYYMTPEEYESYKEYQKNAYTGIGVTIEQDAESAFLKIRSIAEDSPADRAGLETGDLIIAFDALPLDGKTAAELKSLIAGNKGKEFELTVRAPDGAERTVKISTELVFSNPVVFYMLEDGIGYIKIKNFESESADRSIAALEALMAQGARGVVFDVRNNPGGLLSELTKLLDYLLPAGDMFVSVDENGRETVKKSDARCVELPMCVLVNGDSYSAAEFFAAALGEYEMAKIVGEPTTGKSRSQENVLLPDGSAVHLSTNGYLTPKRVDLAQQGGLVPDNTVTLTEDESLLLLAGDLEFAADPQLKAAHGLLK